jgi:hypothetical protein
MKLKEIPYMQWPRDLYGLAQAIDKEYNLIKCQQLFDEFQCTSNMTGYYISLVITQDNECYLSVFVAA